MSDNFNKAVRILAEASKDEKQQLEIMSASKREDYDFVIRALHSMISCLVNLKVSLAKERYEKINKNKE